MSESDSQAAYSPDLGESDPTTEHGTAIDGRLGNVAYGDVTNPDVHADANVRPDLPQVDPDRIP